MEANLCIPQKFSYAKSLLCSEQSMCVCVWKPNMRYFDSSKIQYLLFSRRFLLDFIVIAIRVLVSRLSCAGFFLCEFFVHCDREMLATRTHTIHKIGAVVSSAPPNLFNEFFHSMTRGISTRTQILIFARHSDPTIRF